MGTDWNVRHCWAADDMAGLRVPILVPSAARPRSIPGFSFNRLDVEKNPWRFASSRSQGCSREIRCVVDGSLDGVEPISHSSVGPLIRIAPNEVISTDPEILRRVAAVRSPYRKGEFYRTGQITPPEHTVVSLRDEDEHKALRAKMGPAVSKGKGVDAAMTLTNFG
jgi:hypothetical protein